MKIDDLFFCVNNSIENTHNFGDTINMNYPTENKPTENKPNSDNNDYLQLSAICGYIVASTFANIYLSDNPLMSVSIDGEVGGNNKPVIDRKNKINRLVKIMEIESKELLNIRNEIFNFGPFTNRSIDKMSRLNITIFDLFLKLFKEEIEGGKFTKEANCSIINNGVVFSGAPDQQRSYKQELFHRYIYRYIIPAETINTDNVVFPRNDKLSIDTRTLDIVVTIFLVVLWTKILEIMDNKLMHTVQLMKVLDASEKIYNNKYYNIQTNNSRDFDVAKAFEFANYFGSIFKLALQETLDYFSSKCRTNMHSVLIENQSKIVRGQ